MNKCPLTYQSSEEGTYSKTGLHRISYRLNTLKDLPYDAEALRFEAIQRAGKLSIQGIQAKLSARLNLRDQCFDIVDQKGMYILKPQTHFPQLPENEDLTMHIAATTGMNVPLHGLIYAKDKSLVYFIQRFDRKGHHKIATEDFAQLAGGSRMTKYNYSMEGLVDLIDRYCTFPVVEKAELLKRTLFNFLIGNEDMHLKNFSVITQDKIVRLSPVYDLLNSCLVLKDPEEIALPLRGKKRGLTRNILLKYFGQDRLQLEARVIEDQLELFARLLPTWKQWIERSFLSPEFQERYQTLLVSRARELNLL